VNQPQVLFTRLAQLARDRGEQFLPVGQLMLDGQRVAGRKLSRRKLGRDDRQGEKLAAFHLIEEFLWT